MIINTLVKILGQPKSNGYNFTQYAFNCPNCSKANLGVNDNKHNLEVRLYLNDSKYNTPNVYKCWKCGISGDVLKLIRYYGSGTQLEEYVTYVESVGYIIPPEKKSWGLRLPKEFIPFTKGDKSNPEHGLAYKYITNERNLDMETVHRFNVGFCLSGKFKQRIILPSYDANGFLNYFVARTYVDHPKKYDTPRDVQSSDIIFNESNINWNLPVFLTEGGFELLSWPENNIPLCGKVLHDKLLQKLVDTDVPVVIALNQDAFELKASERINEVNRRSKSSSTQGIAELLKAYGKKDIKYVEMPVDDFGEIQKMSGKKGIFDLIRNNIRTL
jgi:predicted RNA-binding Zn-ribbon protein involved in translation (DUF1610 family)